jgi:hypothetical protein
LRHVRYVVSGLLLCGICAERSPVFALQSSAATPGIATEDKRISTLSGATTVPDRPPALDLSAIADHARPLRVNRRDDLVLPHAPEEEPGAPALSFGPISFGSMRTETDSRGMVHRRAPTFQVEGVSLFGSSISGSVDGRSAHITLTWHTSGSRH